MKKNISKKIASINVCIFIFQSITIAATDYFLQQPLEIKQHILKFLIKDETEQAIIKARKNLMSFSCTSKKNNILLNNEKVILFILEVFSKSIPSHNSVRAAVALNIPGTRKYLQAHLSSCKEYTSFKALHDFTIMLKNDFSSARFQIDHNDKQIDGLLLNVSEPCIYTPWGTVNIYVKRSEECTYIDYFNKYCKTVLPPNARVYAATNGKINEQMWQFFLKLQSVTSQILPHSSLTSVSGIATWCSQHIETALNLKGRETLSVLSNENSLIKNFHNAACKKTQLPIFSDLDSYTYELQGYTDLYALKIPAEFINNYSVATFENAYNTYVKNDLAIGWQIVDFETDEKDKYCLVAKANKDRLENTIFILILRNLKLYNYIHAEPRLLEGGDWATLLKINKKTPPEMLKKLDIFDEKILQQIHKELI